MTIDSNSFRQVFEEMEDPAFFHDSQYRLIQANEAYYREACVVEGDVLGKPYWEVFPKGKEPLPSCKTTVLNGVHTSSSDEVVVGDKAFISRGYVLRDAQGKPSYYLHILSDISKRIASEKALAKIATQFEILFEASPDAIMLLDDKRFADCNPATLAIFGCSRRSDFIGKHPSQFSPSIQPEGIDSDTLANQRIADAFKYGHNRFEWQHSRLDGSEFPAEVLLVAFEREGKKVLQATVQDITEQKNKQLALDRALTGIVTAMSKTMELRDPYTAGHQSRVSVIACLVAKELGWGEDRIKGLRMAGLVHDIGKIAVPAEMLTKPSRLSEFEEKLMEEHPQHGYELLKDIEFPWPIANFVRQHHERLDGSGYPLGLKNDEITLEARVLGVADTIEAMSTHRPYRAALGLAAALAEIKAQSGIKFDADVVNATLRLFKGKDSLDFLAS